MEPKPFIKSKTLWVNAAALVAAVGVFVQTGDATALIAAGMAVVNMVLRLITHQPIE